MIDAATGWYATPVSIKAVVLHDAGWVLLGMDPRGEWELPGGWPDPDHATLEDTARREVAEESGLDVTVDGFVTAVLHRGNGGLAPVALVMVRARTTGNDVTVLSSERSRMDFFAPDHLPSPLPDTYRRVVALAIGPSAETSPGHAQAGAAQPP